MKTREQRRQRRPLGSVFVGQAPQKRSLAGAASCLLHNIVAPLAKKACQMGSKYTCQIWRKKWQKNCQKTHKIDCKSSKTAPDLANEVAFLTFWPEPVILRGYNMM